MRFVSYLIICIGLWAYAVQMQGQCVISDLDVSVSDCSSGTFDATIDFSFDGSDQAGFGVLIDEVFVSSHIYSDLPIVLMNLDEASTLQVCQSNDLNCCLETTVFANCICDISLEADITNCNPIDQTFTASIAVTGNNVSGQFTLGGNGTTYGNFAYADSPIQLGPLPIDGSMYSFTALDLDNILCFASADLGVVDRCPEDCSINDFQAEMLECDANFQRFIDISYTVSGVLSNEYNVSVNGISYGTLTGDDNIYTIGPITGACIDSTLIEIEDIIDNNCSARFVIDRSYCCPDSCVFENVFVEGICDAGSISATEIDFDYNGSPQDQFSIFLNDAMVATVTSADLPVLISAALSVPNPMVRIEHTEREDCGFSGEFMVDCTPCVLSNPQLTNQVCTSATTFNATLNMQVQAPISNDFTVMANGAVFGTFPYRQLPIILENLPYNEENTISLSLCDSISDACCVSEDFITVDCRPPCELRDLVATADACADNESFTATLSFIAENPGSTGFSIFSNGINFGVFQYGSDSYQIGPLDGDCETIYEFVIRDNEDPECAATFAMAEPVCCEPDIECRIFGIEVTALECDGDGTYSLELDFEFEGNTNGFFEVSTQNAFIGFFQFDQLPIIINNFPERDAELDILTICENDNPSCCAVGQFNGLDCGTPPECSLTNLSVVRTECGEDGNFFIDLSFDIENPGGSGFTVRGNGTQYGSFPYGQDSYTIGPLVGDCNTLYEFIAIDNVDENCLAFTGLEEVVCCEVIEPCMISNMSVDVMECTAENSFSLVLDFDATSTSNMFFDLWANSEFFGFFQFEDLPITINNFPSSGITNNLITVCENDNPECCSDITFEGLLCENVASCVFSNVTATARPCTDNGDFLVDIDFDLENPPGNIFEIRGNGISYGTFFFVDNFYTVGPLEGDCTTLYEFVIIDLSDSECTAATFFNEPVCCTPPDPCMLSNLSVTPLECTGVGTYSVEVDFDFIGVSNDFFEVFAGDDFLGLFPLADLPITVPNFPAMDTGFDFLRVCINDEIDCCTDTQFSGLECGDENTDCVFDNLFAEASECDDANQYFIDVEFDITDPGESFVISVDGIQIAVFLYGQNFYTVGPFIGNCEDIPVVSVTDNSNTNCIASFTFDQPICCEDMNECTISNVEVTPLECTGDGTYDLILDFMHENANNQFFDLFTQDGLFGTYLLTDLPITIEDFPARDVEFDFLRICINDNNDCCTEFEFIGPECMSQEECMISNVEVTPLECTGDGTYDLILDFMYENATNESFDLFTENGLFGTYVLTDLPITIEDFTERDVPFDFLRVCIDENLDCCMAFEFLGPDCTSQNIDCIIENVFATANSCDNEGMYFMDVEFEVTNPSSAFSIFFDGEEVGSFDYGENFYTVGPFNGDCDNAPTLLIRDNDLEDCSATFEFEEAICCPPLGPCSIENFMVDVIDCDTIENSFFALLNFEPIGAISDSYSVVGNGNNYGTFDYGTGEIQLGPFPIDETEYEFLIIDSDDPACSSAFELGTVNCTISSTYNLQNWDINAYFRDGNLIVENPDNILLERVELLNIASKSVFNGHSFGGDQIIQFDIPDLHHGIYILRVKNNTGWMSIKLPYLY